MSCRVLVASEVAVQLPPWLQNGASTSPQPRSRNSSSADPGEILELRKKVDDANLQTEQRSREAWDQGFRAGEAAAMKRFEAEHRATVGNFTTAAAEIAATRPETIRRAETDTVRLAIEIARRVLHRELTVDPSALEALVKAALEKLKNQEVFRVRVHPEQEPLVRSCLEQSGRGLVEVISDPAQARGGASFEVSRGTLDASVETQLREIEFGLTDHLQTRS